MNALWLAMFKGGGGTAAEDPSGKGFGSGVIAPCPSRGLSPFPAATRGGSLQVMTSAPPGAWPGPAERENSPAGPSGVTVRDKEKP